MQLLNCNTRTIQDNGVHNMTNAEDCSNPVQNEIANNFTESDTTQRFEIAAVTQIIHVCNTESN